MRLSFKKYFFLGVVLGVLSSSVFAVAPLSAHIMAGQYTTSLSLNLPLLAVSDEQGANWTYPADILNRLKWPALQILDSNFYSAGCTGQFCVASGFYIGALAIYYHPLVAVSQDPMHAWSYVKLPEPDQNTYFSSNRELTSCNSTYCVIGMTYTKEGDWNSIPYIARSRDKGLNWTYTTIPSDKPSTSLAFRDMDCSDQSCVIVGYTLEPTLMRIAVSKDQAATWSYVNTDDLAAKYHEATLNSVKCNGRICLAAGTYTYRGSVSSEDVLLVLRSMDGGLTWSNVVPANNTPTPIDTAGQIAYSNHTWVITANEAPPMGSYVQLPVVFVSQDDGLTWTQPTTIQSNLLLLPRSKDTSVSTGGVSCSGKFCAIPVYSSNGSTCNLGKDFLFGIAMSHDSGVSWTYADVSPADKTACMGLINMIHCTAQSCVAEGSYTSQSQDPAKDPNKVKPFVTVTSDQGKTWSTPVAIMDNLPKNFVSGGFETLAKS